MLLMTVPNQYLVVIFSLFSIIFQHNILAQTVLDIKGHADCNTRLSIETKKSIGPSSAPLGYGQQQEFSKNSKEDLYFMENENHSVWYQFVSKTSGTISFEIAPLNPLDDYDFALYKYTNENFCADVIQQKQLPIRTNFSRNKVELGGKTGLRKDAQKKFVPQGIQATYSKATPVKKGDTLVLLVNSVYKNSAGHKLHFNYESNHKLSTDLITKPKEKIYKEEPTLIRWGGRISNSNNQYIGKAQVNLIDTKTKELIAQGVSDSATGLYYLVFFTLEDQLKQPLYLEVQRLGYLFKDTVINPYVLSKSIKHIPIQLSMQQLKKGKRFALFNIGFPFLSDVPLSRSQNSVQALLKMMQNNKSLEIRIEGHANGYSNLLRQPYSEELALKISIKRAHSIMNFLIKNGISSHRLSAIGHGVTRNLYGNQSFNAHLNRRIEIEITNI